MQRKRVGSANSQTALLRALFASARAQTHAEQGDTRIDIGDPSPSITTWMTARNSTVLGMKDYNKTAEVHEVGSRVPVQGLGIIFLCNSLRANPCGVRSRNDRGGSPAQEATLP